MHLARWMGHILAGLKADLLFKHVPAEVLSATQLLILQRINRIMVHVIIRFWFQATLAADAPSNTLELYQELLKYRRIDKELADLCIAKLQRHLWFAAEEFAPWGLASEKVSPAEKSEIAACLLEQPRDQLRTGPPKMPPLALISTLASRIGPQSWHFFHRLNISPEFLSEPVETWPQIPAFQKFQEFIDNVHIVNDVAER
jgi:hypothetical protein